MPHPTCTPPRPFPDGVLDQLVGQIAEAHAGAPHASLLRLRPGADGVEVGLCSLPPGVHPCEALLGHVVPPAWAASGVVAPGWARRLDRPDDPGTGTTVVMLVDRDGRVTSHAAGVDVGSTGAGGEAPLGRIPDLLLRTLGLPTPPLLVPAAEWWRACWLDALVTAAADHPGGVPDPDRPLTSTLPVALVEALVDDPHLLTEAGWGRIRLLAARPDEPEDPGAAAVRAAVGPHVAPALAAWMDDGCFGRWLLDALPSVDELVEAAAALVPPALLDQIRRVTHRPEPDGSAPDPAPD